MKLLTLGIRSGIAVAVVFMAIADAFGGVFVDTTQPLDRFRRGDANQDSLINLADAMYLLLYGFVVGSPAPECLDAADIDDNGQMEVLVDAIALLQSLFVPSTPPPSAPGANCGPDPTPDALFCSGVCP